jgi:hypothetical protein
MLLRGDRDLPTDLRVYRDYTEAKDQATRDKIRRFGNPDIYPAIMELTTQLSTRIFQMAEESGLSLMGSALVDQYAAKPIMSRKDYFEYVHPLPYSCLGKPGKEGDPWLSGSFTPGIRAEYA